MFSPQSGLHLARCASSLISSFIMRPICLILAFSSARLLSAACFSNAAISSSRGGTMVGEDCLLGISKE